MIVRKLMLLVFVLSLLISGKEIAAQPTITGLDTTTFSPTNDPVLTWRLSFDQAVTGVSPANFSLAGAGVTANIASATAQPGNMTWTITLDTIAGDGTLGLNLSNPAGITGTTAPLTQTYTGQMYTVDNTSPYVVSITRLDASPTLASSVSYQITFSEPIFNLSTMNFAPGGTPSGFVSSVTATADPAVWIGVISSISGTGRLSLDLTDTSGVTDAAGNWLFSDYTAGEKYDIPPQLLCISRLDPTPTSATAVRYNVQFNAPVNGLTAANVALSAPAGSTVSVAPNPAPAPAFNWIVTIGSIAGDGPVSINLQTTSTVTEGSGVSPMNFNPVNCNDNTYLVDQTPPTANCVQISNPATNTNPTSSTSVQFSVSFSDPVTGVSDSNFTLTTSDLISYTTGTWTTNDAGLTWLLDITGISENTANSANGHIEIAWANADGIIDVAGNQPAIPACAPAYYDIDQRGANLACVTREPAGTDELTSLSQVTFRVTFDEPVTTDSVSADDFQVVFVPPAGFISADVTTVTAVTTGTGTSTEFIVTVSNIVGNNAATPPFRYNSNNSIGNGYLTLTLAPGATVYDLADNPVVQPPALAASCGATSYTVDQVRPAVKSIDFANGDCLTSAVFTLVFTEQVTTVTANDLEVIWTGGDCHSTFTVSQIIRQGPETFSVDVKGTYTLFHQNGPGSIALRVLANGTIVDFAGNPMDTPFDGDLNFVCRCFEPAVATAPTAILNDTTTYPLFAPGTVVCAGTDTCTSVGLLRGPYFDTPTTTTTPDYFQWKATEWDCNSTAPFAIYLDELLLGTTDGNTTLSALSQSDPGTTNSFCSPIGESFSYPFPGPLTPGLHSYRISQTGGCTTGTQVFFNVLDTPNPRFPGSNIESCRQPRVFEWDAVDGAEGYELYFKAAGDPCMTLIARTGSDTTSIDVADFGLTPGNYNWYVQAFNQWGHSAAQLTTFTISAIDPTPPSIFTTNGVVYDMYVTSTTTYIAGDFSMVSVGNVAHARTNMAAFDNVTRQLTTWNPAVNGPVFTMKPSNGYLYIGGDFTGISGTSVGRIARLEPDTSTTLTTDYRLDKRFLPGANDTVRAIEIVGDIVYYGGDFTKVGVQVYNFGNFEKQVNADRLATASVTMTAESTPPPASANLNPNATVYDLLRDGNHLYIAGAFSSIGGHSIRALARATLSTTGTIDTSFNMNINADISHYVYTMEKVGNRLYLGGSFTSVQGQSRKNAANLILDTAGNATVGRWDPQPAGAIYAIRSQGVGFPIYIGGTFTTLRQLRFAYFAGVDPVAGYPLTCSYNADRLIYAIDLWTPVPGINPKTQVFAAGQATIAGP